MSVRTGLIGAGDWGAQLVRTLSGRTDIALCHVADADVQRLHNVAPGMRHGTSIDDLCNDASLDAIMIATPPSTHVALARAALRAGKHYWVEKPLALCPDDAQELVMVARAQQGILFVDETFLYDPLVRRARDWIGTGRLGRVYHYSFERLSMGRIRRDSDIWWNAAPHDLALLRFLAPSAVASIRVERWAHVQPQIADVCTATAQLDDGASVHFYLSWLSPVKMGRVVAVGSNGMLVYDGRFGARALTRFEYRLREPHAQSDNLVPIEQFAAVETIPGGNEEPLSLAVDAFVHSIRTGEPAPSDGRFSLETVKLLAVGWAPPTTPDPR